MVSKDQKMSKQCAADKTKHVTLTAPHKLEIIGTFECGIAAVWLWHHTALDYQLQTCLVLCNFTLMQP
jgi:hypothetical protein